MPFSRKDDFLKGQSQFDTNSPALAPVIFQFRAKGKVQTTLSFQTELHLSERL